MVNDQRNPQVILKGTASYLPDKILSNNDLEKMVDTSDDWIYPRTGMRERRIARDDEFTSDMGAAAASKALAKAKIDPEKVDLCICATISPDYPFPSTACLIQKKIGLKNAFAFDIEAACSGYLYALSIAKGYIASGMYKNILIVAAEKLSSIIDYTDRQTCILFGDGAAAALISRGDDEPGSLELGAISLGSDGINGELLMQPGGGSRHPATQETVQKRLHYLQMDGKEVYKHAVRRLEEITQKTLDKENTLISDIKYFIFHQANKRIIESIAKRFSIPLEQFIMTIEKYGNTSAASVGIGLDQLLSTQKIGSGEQILLAAFGAGITYGSAMLKRKK